MMEIIGSLICFGVILLPILLIGYVYIRNSINKSKHPPSEVEVIELLGEHPEWVDSKKKSFSLSEEIRKLWKYN